jgi:3-hexulose-6-phosphate synthase
VKLQVALDTSDIGRAILVAADVAPYVDSLEVGYPLMLAEGADAVRRIAAAFPQRGVVADAKIADHGAEIAGQLIGAGARAVTVLASAEDRTIIEVVAACREAGVQVIADLLGVEDLKRSVKRAARHDVDMLYFHRGADGSLEGIEVVQAEGDLPVAIGGGITLESLPTVLAARPSTVIVGRAITGEVNPAAAAEAFARAVRPAGSTFA